jgi:hypothetical protein
MKLYYHVRNSPSVVLILSQMSLVHAILSCVFKIHLNINLPPTPRIFTLVSFFQVFLPKFCMHFVTDYKHSINETLQKKK